MALCCCLAGLPAGAAESAAAAQSAASAAPAASVRHAAADADDLSHGAALVLAAVAAVGFVTRRLRD